MIPVTHPKVASLAPTWTPFAGCSVIFDRFGAQGASASGLVADAADFHAALRDRLLEADRDALQAAGFCPLPVASYHLTVADLVNAGNVRKLGLDTRAGHGEDADARMRVIEHIVGLVGPLVHRSGLLELDVEDLAFGCGGVSNRERRVLVADLVPGPEDRHGAAFERLILRRDALRALLADALGLDLPDYRPHVSLGYFANPAFASASDLAVAALNERIISATAGRSFAFGRPALFLFRDMATFEAVRPVRPDQ